MRIEKRRARLVVLALVFTVLLAACGGRSEKGTDGAVSTTGTKQHMSSSAMVTAHFSFFEVSVPADWPSRGNVGKVFEGPDAFLLAGPVTEGSVEECIAAELELFFNTEYYRSQVAFQYDRYEETPGGIKVRGSLTNGRTGERAHFAGGFFKAPDAYVLYLWSAGDASEKNIALAEASYESFRVL